MGRLVEDLLFLSRAEVGAIRFEMEPIGLQDVLDVALDEARVLAAANDLLLHAQLPNEPCVVEGDAERLTQALLIVSTTQIKYSDPGQGIDVTLKCAAPEAVVSVRNTGPEIPVSDLPFVFNRFYRGHQPATATTTGSGLGLPIAKWIVDTHGGRVELSSTHRETIVTLHLPLIM
jgi:signal transduction histidine kinase